MADANAGLGVGSTLEGRYHLVEELGQGGFATVFLARQAHINREVAIKILDVGVGDADEENFRKRFLQEAQITSQLHHPNIVTIYEFGFAGPAQQPFIAMERLHGHDLGAEITENGPMPLERAIRLVIPVLHGLAAGHRVGVVHKDLKPPNLFLCNPGEPSEMLKILDYGVARFEGAATLTKVGEFTGTPQYVAPEYARYQTASPSIDVYQMALIFLELLTGELVVPDQDPVKCIIRHASGDLDLPPYIMDSPMGDVMRKALNIDYKERYPEGGAFAEALATVDVDAVSQYVDMGKMTTLLPGGMNAAMSKLPSGPMAGAVPRGSPAGGGPESGERAGPKMRAKASAAPTIKTEMPMGADVSNYNLSESNPEMDALSYNLSSSSPEIPAHVAFGAPAQVQRPARQPNITPVGAAPPRMLTPQESTSSLEVDWNRVNESGIGPGVPKLEPEQLNKKGELGEVVGYVAVALIVLVLVLGAGVFFIKSKQSAGARDERVVTMTSKMPHVYVDDLTNDQTYGPIDTEIGLELPVDIVVRVRRKGYKPRKYRLTGEYANRNFPVKLQRDVDDSEDQLPR